MRRIRIAAPAALLLVVFGSDGRLAGRGNGHDSSPSVALAMYFCQIWAGNEPPVTVRPWTFSMSLGVPSGFDSA